MFRNIKLKIKWAWQRVVRGYDDRVKWGFDSYFLEVMPALREFCIDYLDGDTAKYNEGRSKIFKKTIKLIDEHYSDVTWNGVASIKLLTYVGKNSAYYWD